MKTSRYWEEINGFQLLDCQVLGVVSTCALVLVISDSVASIYQKQV